LPLTEKPDLARSAIALCAARKSDAPALAKLRAVFWADQISKGAVDHPDIEPTRLLADTDKLIERARTFVLLATDRDKPAGYIFGQTKILPGIAGSRISSIEELFVEPAYRRTNVAQSLVEKSIAEFQASGAQRIQLRALENNDEGRSFWRRMGFYPSVTIYEYIEPGNSTNR
jgi:ribosomal protein S18 acetylase RimI-like enzyme